MEHYMICFGDSLVFGYKVAREYKWTTLLNDNYDKMTVLNRGTCSETTGDMLKRFDKQVLQKTPDKVLILGGYNNVFQTYSIEQAVIDLGSMVRQSLEHHIDVIMCVPPPIVYPYDPEYWSEIVDLDKASPLLLSLNEEIIKLYERIKKARYEADLELIDLYAPFAGLDDISEYYLDEFHQNPKGHRLIFEEVFKKL